jgi:hypothetical protein
MKKARTLLILAIWVAILPYMGFPMLWKNLLFLATGLALAYISYLEYRKAKPKEIRAKKVFDNFSENSHDKLEETETEKEKNQNNIDFGSGIKS